MHASRLYLLLFSLYWAQGLPVGFMTHALPVILRAQGVSLAQIGGFGLLMLPWSIKILWAPWVDRFGSSRIGHYRRLDHSHAGMQHLRACCVGVFSH